MSRVIFEWDGDEVERRLYWACREAVDATVDEARDLAKAEHFDVWQNTPTRWSPAGGQLEDAIISEHSTVHDRNPTGRFGFARRHGFYGLFHEVGTSHEYEKPVLRPVADQIFPRLAHKIKERFRP